ncbi:MAG: hypothetical protein WA052_04240 [Microgenomates group bacterium]
MPNDDLGSFPMPQQTPSAPVEPVVADTLVPPPSTVVAPISNQEEPPHTEPIMPTMLEDTPPATPPIITPDALPEPQTPPISSTFEETPEEIPSQQTSSVLVDEHEKLAAANESMIEKQSPSIISQPVPQPESVTPVETPPVAALPPKSRSLAPVIIVVLLIVAGVGLAAAAYLSTQSNKLKEQLSEITQTLEKQKTILTPTVTPTVFQIPTPTIATQGAIIATPSATPTTIPITNTNQILPLANAAAVLKVAINHSPTAQLILIKVDNATDPSTAVTKYFFREDLTTKKYFFVSISSNGIPELIDKQIYVNPDNNIPSLNDAVLTNKMGMDLDETLKLTYAQCANQEVCIAAPVKAMYINTGSGITWQLSLYTNGLSATPLLIQINAETKAIIYKSPEFSNK